MNGKSVFVRASANGIKDKPDAKEIKKDSLNSESFFDIFIYRKESKNDQMSLL